MKPSLFTALKVFMREKTDEILGYNNKIAEIQKESELATDRVLEEQTSSDRQIVLVTERSKLLGQVRRGVEGGQAPTARSC